MNEEISKIDSEAIEELREVLYKLSGILEPTVLALQKQTGTSEHIRELFRQFHTLKALSGYLGYKNIFMVSKVIEDVLAILRQKEQPVRSEVIDWLLIITDTIKEWSDDAQAYRFDFAPIDAFTLNMVRTSVVLPKRADEILSNANIFYLDSDTERSAAVHRLSRQNIPTLITFSSGADVIKRLEVVSNCILVFNVKVAGANMLKFIDRLMNEFNLPIMAVSDGVINSNVKEQLRRHGVEYFLNNFLSENALFDRLLNTAKVFFETKGIKVLKHPLQNKIANLKPLSSTATEINKLRAKADASLKDVSDAIAKDSIVSAKVLKIANSPYSGIKGSISSVHHAISMLGKEQVMGMVLQQEMEKFVKINLSPYMMREEDFFAISCLRMNLATYWYPKVSVAKTGMLATVALLGSLGQLIIADELEKIKKSDKFSQLIQSTSSPMFAEMEFFATTSEDITADILTQWGVDDTIVNLLHYANDITSVSDELKQDAVALFVIFNTIPSIPTGICDAKVEEMKEFLKEMNFNPSHYEKAVKKVREDCKF